LKCNCRRSSAASHAALRFPFPYGLIKNLSSQKAFMSRFEEVKAEIMGIGVAEHDAMVIADCVVTRKSCSWVNTDEVSDKLLLDLNNLVKKNNYGIVIKVQPVPTRSKFIWEIKVV